MIDYARPVGWLSDVEHTHGPLRIEVRFVSHNRVDLKRLLLAPFILALQVPFGVQRQRDDK